MSDGPRYSSLRDYLRVMREQRVLIVLVTLIFAGAALGLSLRAEEIYQARSSVAFVDERNDFQLTGDAAPPSQSPEQRAAVYAGTLNDLQLATRVKERVGIDRSARALQADVTLRAENRTNLVVVEVQDTDPQTAADVANAYAREAERLVTDQVRDEFSSAARNLRRETGELGRSPDEAFSRQINRQTLVRLRTLARIADPANVVEQATVPSTPIAPKPIRNTLLGAILGLSLAILAAFVRDALDRRLRGAHEIRDELKLPLIGYVRDDVLGHPVVSLNGKRSLSSEDLEAFRILRTNFDFLDVDQPLKTVLVTSGLPEEGKSTVSASLAFAYVAAGKRTLLVETDMRRPTLAERYGLDAKPGLTDYLGGEVEPSATLQTLALPVPARDGAGDTDTQPSLVCITAGSYTPRPAELLGSKRFADFLAQVSDAYDIVVLDSSPLLSVVDTLELLPLVDGVLFCVRASKTTRDQARAAKAALEHFPARPTGIVVTGLKHGDDADYGYYSYAYAYGPAKDR